MDHWLSLLPANHEGHIYISVAGAWRADPDRIQKDCELEEHSVKSVSGLGWGS